MCGSARGVTAGTRGIYHWIMVLQQKYNFQWRFEPPHHSTDLWAYLNELYVCNWMFAEVHLLLQMGGLLTNIHPPNADRLVGRVQIRIGGAYYAMAMWRQPPVGPNHYCSNQQWIMPFLQPTISHSPFWGWWVERWVITSLCLLLAMQIMNRSPPLLAL